MMLNYENLSPERIKRVEKALAETRALIAKEQRYSPEFQKTDYLENLISHETKLIDILNKNNVKTQ